MTAKLSGTDGLLQSYDYQTPSTGFSYTFAAGTQMLFMVPAATLATGTITMPSAPADGMVITFSSSQQITALTLQGNTGQSISSAVTFLPAKTAVSYVYRLSNLTWYPCQTVPGTGSQIIQGVSQATTSGTSIDFTGIPSWVKRITVMLNGVSTNGTSFRVIRLGTSGGIVATGYQSGAFSGGSANQYTNSTTDFVLTYGFNSTAAATMYGAFTITNLSGNNWILSGTYAEPAAYGVGGSCGGSVTLSGTLDRLRLTTQNGTDAFDAGSVNILYE
jgi:hypothetical protein